MRFALALLALIFAAASPSESFAGSDLVARGHAIARANCSRCHALGAKDESPNAAAPPFRTLNRKYPLRDLEEALAEGIVVGHGETNMPRFQFSPPQIEALLAYLATIQRK